MTRMFLLVITLLLTFPALAQAKSFTQTTAYWSDCKLTYHYTSYGTIPEDDLLSIGDVLVGHYGMYAMDQMKADIVKRNGKNVPLTPEAINEAELGVGMLYMNTRDSAYRNFKIQKALINCAPSAVGKIRQEVEQAEAERRAQEERAAAEKRRKVEEKAEKVAAAIEKMSSPDQIIRSEGYEFLMETSSEEGDQVLVEFLRKRLAEIQPEHKHVIIKELQKLGKRAKAALPDVLPYIQQLGTSAQAEAIYFAEKIGDPAAIDALRYAVVEAPLLPEETNEQGRVYEAATENAENARVAIKVILGRDEAETFLKRIDAEIRERQQGQATAEHARMVEATKMRVQSLIERLESGNQEAKRKAVYELGGGVTKASERPLRGDEIAAAIPALGKELESGNSDEFYRMNIATTLGKTGDESAVPYLKSALGSEQSSMVRDEIENALREILGPNAESVIEQAKRGTSDSSGSRKKKQINPGELLKKGLKGFGF